MVPIHLGVRTVANEINRFRPGIHLAAILTTVACEFRGIVFRNLRDAKPKIGDYLWLR